MNVDLSPEARAVLPEAVQKVTKLCYGDMMAELQGVPSSERELFWANASREFRPFSDRIQDIRRTLISIPRLREETPPIAYIGAGLNFKDMADLVAQRLLTDIVFYRSQAYGADYTTEFEVKAIAKDLGLETPVRTATFAPLTTERVVEAMLDGRLGFSRTEVQTPEELDTYFYQPNMPISELFAIYPKISSVRSDMGYIRVFQDLNRRNDRVYNVFAGKDSAIKPRPSAFISTAVFSKSRAEGADPSPKYSYYHFDTEEDGTITVVENKPIRRTPIVDVVKKAVYGIELVHALLTRQDNEGDIRGQKVYDYAYGRPAISDYTEFHPVLVQYLRQQVV